MAAREIPRLAGESARLRDEAISFLFRAPYWALKIQAVQQLLDFIFGAGNGRDRDRVAVRQHHKRRLAHDARSNIFVKIGSDERLRSDGNLVRLLVSREALGFGHFAQRTKILFGILQTWIRRYGLGGDQDRRIYLFAFRFGRPRKRR